MSPSSSFIKFILDDISNNHFHDAYERIPEAERLLEKCHLMNAVSAHTLSKEQERFSHKTSIGLINFW
jgi:hypothetical protein